MEELKTYFSKSSWCLDLTLLQTSGSWGPWCLFCVWKMELYIKVIYLLINKGKEVTQCWCALCMADFWAPLFGREHHQFQHRCQKPPQTLNKGAKEWVCRKCDWEMRSSVCLPCCRLVPAWDLDVGFLIWRSLMRLCIGGWCWRCLGGQGDLRAGGSGSVLPTQTSYITHASTLSLFSLHSLYLPLGCCLFRFDLEFVDYFLWIILRKTGVEWKGNSINPSPVIYFQGKRKLSSETTQISSFITMVIFKFQVTLLIQL